MENEIKMILEEGNGFYEEKKSRFLACIRPVKTQEEALAFIEEKKKQYWDARHNCSAYRIGIEQPVAHCSDDGEPSGTAGRPMLEVLTREGLTNVVAVVTRYFGGVLLGTGGLVRAYQASLKDAIEHVDVVSRQAGVIYSIKTDYNGMGKLQYYFTTEQIPILETVYEADVTLRIICPLEQCRQVEKKTEELTNGKSSAEKLSDTSFCMSGGKVLLLE